MVPWDRNEIARWLDARSINHIDPGEFPPPWKEQLAGSHLKKKIYVGCTPGQKPAECMAEVRKCLESVLPRDALKLSPGRTYPLLSFNMGGALDGDPGAAAILIGDDGQEVLYHGMRYPFVFASPNVRTPDEAATTRAHNCSTMLGIGADHVSPEDAAYIARVWLEAEFDPFVENGVRLRRYLECVKFGLDACRTSYDTGSKSGDTGPETLVLFSDHSGKKARQSLMAGLGGRGYKLVDVGTDSDERCDYPLFAALAARELVSKSGKGSRAIGICGSGIGAAAGAKMWGVYPARCTTPHEAEKARSKYDANMLTLPAGDGTPFGMVLIGRIADCFLSTDFDPAGAGLYRDSMLRKETQALRTLKKVYYP